MDSPPEREPTQALAFVMFAVCTRGDESLVRDNARFLGSRPSAHSRARTATSHGLVDVFLWVKPPGESDGTCNGGPAAGRWWPEYALGLAERQTRSIAMA